MFNSLSHTTAGAGAEEPFAVAMLADGTDGWDRQPCAALQQSS